MLISLNERLRRISTGFRLCEDDYETIWLEDVSKPSTKMKRLGTVMDAERFISKLEITGRGSDFSRRSTR